MEGYRVDETNARETSTPEYTRVNLWWTVAAFAPGLAVNFFGGPLLGDGAAEIAGIMLTSTLLMMRMFARYELTRWFLALLAFWTIVHVAILAFIVLPMKIHSVGRLWNLVWLEVLAFAALANLSFKWWRNSERR